MLAFDTFLVAVNVLLNRERKMQNVIKLKPTGINSAKRKQIERELARMNRLQTMLIVRNLVVTATVMVVWYAVTVFLLSQ